MLYPHLSAVIRFAKGLGLNVSASTNGYLLSRTVVEELEDAGLDALQVSVDRMTPTQSTRKAMKTIGSKLAHLKGSRIRTQVSGVLFDETLSECQEVLDVATGMGFSAHFRLVHPDPRQSFRVSVGERRRLSAFLYEMMGRKAQGERIHTTWAILNYQKAMLEGRPVDWTCRAGYKYFFISSQGKFWPCSMLRTDVNIDDVTLEMLASYDRKKTCQTSCGVYCVVSTSLLTAHPVRFLMGEVGIDRRWVAGKGTSDGTLGIEPAAEGVA